MKEGSVVRCKHDNNKVSTIETIFYTPNRTDVAIMIRSHETDNVHGGYQWDDLTEVDKDEYPEYFL